MRIECPICEYQIDLDSTSDLSTPMTCGSCNKSFSFSPDLVIQPTQKIPTDTLLKPTLPAAKIIPDPASSFLGPFRSRSAQLWQDDLSA